MIDFLAAILMSLFQGIIEWLPISSEGQLSLLFVTIYGLDELAAVTLALFLHLGTMISVIWYFRKDILERLRGWDVGPGLDGDIVLKIRKIGYKVVHEPEAICYTNVPNTFIKLGKQCY